MRAHANPCPPVVHDVPNRAGLSIGLASDLHAHLEDGRASEPSRLVDALSVARRDIMLLLGDVYHAPASCARSTASEVMEVVQGLAQRHDHVVFVPGNHDLRHLDDPWQRYKKLERHKRILMPQGHDPVVENVGGVRIMAANVFYDGSLFDHADVELLGQRPDELPGFYSREMDDSASLFHRAEEDFAAYKHAADRVLTHDHAVDILATHVPPHAAAMSVAVPSYTQEDVLRHFSRKGVRLLADEERNEQIAKSMPWFERSGGHMAVFYRNMVLAAYWSGSNILGTCGSEPEAVTEDARYELLALFGHTHQRQDHLATVGRRRVRFLAHPTRCAAPEPPVQPS